MGSFVIKHLILVLKVNLHLVTAKQQRTFLKLCKVIGDSKYNYNETMLYYKVFLNSSLHLKTLPAKVYKE